MKLIDDIDCYAVSSHGYIGNDTSSSFMLTVKIHSFWVVEMHVLGVLKVAVLR